MRLSVPRAGGHAGEMAAKAAAPASFPIGKSTAMQNFHAFQIGNSCADQWLPMSVNS
jgi:hypothetical protein